MHSAYWAQLFLGLWILISPWILGAQTAPIKWSNVIMGTALVLLNLWLIFGNEDEPKTPQVP